MPKAKATASVKEKVHTATQDPMSDSSSAAISPEAYYRMIAEAAYYRAEQRGFVGSDSAQDWIETEAEIGAMLGRTH